jgi:hypothetical protein
MTGIIKKVEASDTTSSIISRTVEDKTTTGPDSQDAKENLNASRASTSDSLMLDTVAMIAEQNEFFKKQIKGLERKLASANKEIQNKLAEANRKIDDTSLRTEDIKTKVIETLAVFTALFTFLSITFQILKDNSNPILALSLIAVAAGILIIFVLLVDWVARYWRYEANTGAEEPKGFAPWYKRLVWFFWIAVMLLSVKT